MKIAKSMKSKSMLQISNNIRITRLDKLNLQIEEYRPILDQKTKTERYEWCGCGYYGNLKSAFLGVLKHHTKDLVKDEIRGCKAIIKKLEEIETNLLNAVKELKEE